MPVKAERQKKLNWAQKDLRLQFMSAKIMANPEQ